MKLRFLTLAAIVASTFTSAPGAEETNPLLDRGTLTFGLAAGGWHRYSSTASPGDSWGTFSLSPEFGGFVKRGLWLGGGITISKVWAGEWGSISSGGVRGGADYHFDRGSWAPYLGFWGLLGDFPGDGVMPRLGVKFYVVPRTALAVGYDAAFTWHGDYGGGNDVHTSQTIWYGLQVHF
ncbi:MAG TPA: hypothetical protein VMW93_06150 [bacterium]|nr:hypothetical protein [bacterium]